MSLFSLTKKTAINILPKINKLKVKALSGDIET